MDESAIRLYLHGLLEAKFPDLNAYYRPPGDMLLVRPCIVYTPLRVEPSYANSVPYTVGTRFQVTILSNLPGYSNPRRILEIPTIVVTDTNTFVSDDVVHDVFTITINAI